MRWESDALQTDDDLQSIGGAAPSPRVFPLRERVGKRGKRTRRDGDKKYAVRRDDLSRRHIVDRDAYGFPAWLVNTRTDKGSRVIYEETSS